MERKRWSYTYLDSSRSVIACMRRDVTDVYASETDAVTGIYTYSGFRRAVRRMIADNPEIEMCIRDRWCRRGDDNVTVRYLTLSRAAKMQPIVITIPAGMDTGASKSHPGDEFFYVLDGKVRFFYDDEAFDMKKGDFLYYDGLFQHHWQNMSCLLYTSLLLV